MSAQYWEPWTPEVGQRVRVRLSGECQFAEQNGGAHTVYIEPFSEDGVIGRAVPAVWPTALEAGHAYFVAFEDGQGAASSGRGGWYAAMELEPIGEPS